MTTEVSRSVGELLYLDPDSLQKNPNNPRRYFNEGRLDLLRTSIQEVGILVPLIAYEDPQEAGTYVLMDGERRWICALDLALDQVPANVIGQPEPLDNLLRMFNIHNVREEWPLISIALSLREVMNLSEETRESRLAELTGLTRSTVRRARRLLSLPEAELELIQNEAHLDRTAQVHREDLYLEIEAATSVIQNQLPELGKEYPREQVIRQFAKKREVGSLTAVTDFRSVGKIVKAVDDELVTREDVLTSTRKLIEDPYLSPVTVFNEIAAGAYEQQAMGRKIELLVESLDSLDFERPFSQVLLDAMRDLNARLSRILEGIGS